LIIKIIKLSNVYDELFQNGIGKVYEPYNMNFFLFNIVHEQNIMLFQNATNTENMDLS